MMKQKGFTLIELLAVMAILVIILAIAVPGIGGIIRKAREAAFIDTAYGLMSASKYKRINDILIGDSPKGFQVIYPQDKDKLDAQGEMPDSGAIIVKETGEIALALWSDAVGKCAVKNFDEAEIRYDESITLKEDCASGVTSEVITEMWDGWITMTLYYPLNASDRQWRLGSPGEVRADGSFMWNDYTGPIVVPLSRVEDIWIKYKLDNKEVIIPPLGTVLVDIVPDSYGYKLVEKVKVKINYDEEATIKEYRVGDSDWMPYTEEFTVTENVMIEARAKKPDNVYDNNGNLVSKRTAVGRDYIYIGNIGVEESELPAPTIERIAPSTENEVARVKITYPEAANKKIYKENYGLEQAYTKEISIKRYGTHIIAYYYDASGKRSKATSIYINEPVNGGGDSSGYHGSTSYTPRPARKKGETILGTPKYVVKAPTISINPTTVTSSVEVSVSSPASAEKVYLRLGNGKYKLYTSPVTVRSNMQVSAYYVTYKGERSNTAYRRVRNIKTNNKPYLEVDADPYPYPNSYGNNSVTVTLNYSDADRVEYSLDGVVFKPYTNSFSVSQNIRVYGRATNQYGTTERYLDITNIGDMKAPTPREKLSVTITAVPEPVVSKTPTDKVLVMINYDNKATKRYYSLGKYGPLVEYTGEFEVAENTTIYAYALSDNGRGQTSKKIDNLSRGISEPNIIGNPSNNVQTSKTKITIEYDKNATVKRYSINGGALRDYTTPFEVSENGEIYATSSNALGEVSDATYEVANIVSPPPTFIIDKGDYFILKLNYPPNSKVKEYKFTNEGSWKTYKEDGILLIKAKYKDKLLNNKNELKIKVENELGEKVTFNGDWYVLTSSISNLQDNIFMRWDRSIPPTPQIIPNTIEAAREVELTIMYNDALLKKQYKVVGPDGEMISDYGPYKEKIKVTRKNTIIYARGQDDAEVWSLEGIYKVTNIDEEQPVIKLTMDLETKTTQLGIKVSVTDDVRVSKVKWAKGILGESYFKTKGVEMQNNSVVNIAENDYYTFYAEDGVGNKQVYTINVENIDLTPPSIEITATPDKAVGVESTIAIDYGDATTKQYKIGNSAVWINYTSPFKITSYTVLSNNVHNDDGTVTIYAKGKDSVGNEIVVTKKIVNLDLDMPKAPTITSSAGYPVLKSYGVDLDATTTITYDNRSDIDNFYSLDNGESWVLYTGPFDLSAGQIQAKSVKKSTGLEVSVTKSISMPGDAILPAAFDGDSSTSHYFKGWVYPTIYVDSSVAGQKVRLHMQGGTTSGATKATKRLYFYDSNNVAISTITFNNNYNQILTIPEGTVRIVICPNGAAQWVHLYEIELSNEPTFSATNGYMLLHADKTKEIRNPYQMVSINYFPTSVQRLYRIGDTGEWLNYEDKPVRVNQGDTIYAKGIDTHGNETRIISSYTANVSDAILPAAFDGDSTTNHYFKGWVYPTIYVDSSVVGRGVRFHMQGGTDSGSSKKSKTLYFYNSNDEVVSSVTFNNNYDQILTIPEGTVRIVICPNGAAQWVRLYELEVSNEPTISATNGYMLLHMDPTKEIRSPYQMVTITYFPTSVQRLYRIGDTGEWLNYENKPVWVNQGDTIYAKGIDKYGNETRITSSYTANVSDAILPAAFDGDSTTSHYFKGWVYPTIYVDSSVAGQGVRFHMQGGTDSGATKATKRLYFYDSNNVAISTVTFNNNYNQILTIPEGTVRIVICPNGAAQWVRIYEIEVSR